MKDLDSIVENICIALTCIVFMVCCSYTLTHTPNHKSTNFNNEKQDTTIIKCYGKDN